MNISALKKYLPPVIALVLAIACWLTLLVYDKNFYEHTTLSVTMGEYEFELALSRSNKVVSIRPMNKKAFDAEDEFKYAKGKDSSLALRFFSDKLVTEGTLMYVVTAGEDSEISIEELKQTADEAAKELDGNFLYAYTHHTLDDVSEASGLDSSVGKIAFSRYLAKLSEAEADIYVGRHSIISARPDFIAYFVHYMKANLLPEEKHSLIYANAENAKPSFDIISEEDAYNSLVKNSADFYGDTVDDFEFPVILLSSGELRYRFTTEYYGYQTYAYVNIITGSVIYDSEN